MEQEKIFYQVESYTKEIDMHFCYDVYENKEEAQKFADFVKNQNRKLEVWINTVIVHFKK